MDICDSFQEDYIIHPSQKILCSIQNFYPVFQKTSIFLPVLLAIFFRRCNKIPVVSPRFHSQHRGPSRFWQLPCVEQLLTVETPKALTNVRTHITGSVRQLCVNAAEICSALGYEPTILTASLCCSARDAGSFLSSIAQYHADSTESLAFIAGGETVVRLTGNGKGGHNQEIALSAAEGMAGPTGTNVNDLSALLIKR